MQLLTTIDAAATRLHNAWAGRTIVDIVDLGVGLLADLLPNVAAADLKPRLVGQKISSVRRRGRHLLVSVNTGPNLYRWFVLQWTPGVSGYWDDSEASGIPGLRLDLDDGKSWFLYDKSRFGRIWLWSHAEIVQLNAGALSRLGPDWLLQPEDAKNRLADTCTTSDRTVKAVLLDQSIAAGVENVVACEALWAARIHPRTRWKHLAQAETLRLSEVLAVEIGRDLTEIGSRFVYDRKSDWCLRPCCSASISWERDPPPLTTGSYLCPSCQRISETLP